MIKILLIMGGMNCGGAETMMMNILRNIDKNNFKFDFFVNVPYKCYYEDEIIALGGRVIRYVIKGKRPFEHKKNIERAIEEYGPYDVIHAQTLFNSGWAMIAGKNKKIPIRITHSHSTMDKVNPNIFDKIYYKFMRHFITKYSTNYVACGEDAGKYLFGKEWRNKPSLIIKNAINSCFFQEFNQQEIQDLKIQYEIKDNDIILLSVARFSKVKNHEFMIKIAETMRDKNMQFKILLVGDGDLKKDIELMVETKKLKNYVNFLGLRSDLNNILALTNLFIMPSFFEGLPLSVIEAQASGTKCLISDSITNEVDMGLNLIEYLSINDTNIWVEAITKIGLVGKKNYIECRQAILNNNYDIHKSINEIDLIYINKNKDTN